MVDTYRMEVDPDGNVSFFHNERQIFYHVVPNPFYSGFSESGSVAIFDRPLSDFEIAVLNQTAELHWTLPEDEGDMITAREATDPPQ